VECARCGRSDGSPCSSCLDELAAADSVPDLDPVCSTFALLQYDDTSRPFIADLKFHGQWAAARTLAPAMASLLRGALKESAGSPVLTWAPTTEDRVRRRGFDQAEVLAIYVGQHMGLRVRRHLRRYPGDQQTGRSRQERSSGVYFESVRNCDGTVVVVDDVMTTGATLRAAAEVLRSAGATEVIGLALAATPPKVP
jgi:ComF family protein